MRKDNFIDPSLEKGYNIRDQRVDSEQILASWVERSKAFRSTVDATLNCEYDKGAKDKLDVFHCGNPDASVFVFIHGGYWQRGDKSIYSFIAEPFLNSEANVVLVGYSLCPDTTMTNIVEQIRRAMVWLWQHANDIGISAERINLSGHSAGGHLTAMSLTTHWSEYDHNLPDNLIKTGIPISGLYQLQPLLQTTISNALNMDAEEVNYLSPNFLKPSTNSPVLAVLGGEETQQFHWQTDQFIEAWSGHDSNIEKHIEPQVDHFDIINRLANPNSEIFEKVRAWLQ